VAPDSVDTVGLKLKLLLLFHVNRSHDVYPFLLLFINNHEQLYFLC